MRQFLPFSVAVGLAATATLAPRSAHAGPCELAEAKLPLNADTEADDVVIADFNGDGKLDVAFSEMRGRNDTRVKVPSGEVRVFLGKGDGTFGKPIDTTIPVGDMWQPAGVAADFDGDGKTDLVLADQSNPSHGDLNYIVLLGKGNGAFAKPVVAKKSGVSGFHNLRAADIDGDKKADLVASLAVGDDAEIAVMSGKAGGHFGKPVPLKLAGRKHLDYELAYRGKFIWELADLDGDGTPEVVVAPNGLVAIDFDRPHDAGAGNYGVCTLSITRKAKFGKAACYEAKSEEFGPESVAIADVNGDNQLDIVTGPESHSYIDSAHRFDVFLNGGHGAMAKKRLPVAADLSELASIWELHAADVTGDGKVDIVAVGNGPKGSTALVLPGAGDGSFPTATATPFAFEQSGNAALVRFGAFQGAGTLGFVVYAWEGPKSFVHVYSGRCK